MTLFIPLSAQRRHDCKSLPACLHNTQRLNYIVQIIFCPVHIFIVCLLGSLRIVLFRTQILIICQSSRAFFLFCLLFVSSAFITVLFRTEIIFHKFFHYVFEFTFGPIPPFLQLFPIIYYNILFRTGISSILNMFSVHPF